jgi:hypothetical protein
LRKAAELQAAFALLHRGPPTPGGKEGEQKADQNGPDGGWLFGWGKHHAPIGREPDEGHLADHERGRRSSQGSQNEDRGPSSLNGECRWPFALLGKPISDDLV